MRFACNEQILLTVPTSSDIRGRTGVIGTELKVELLFVCSRVVCLDAHFGRKAARLVSIFLWFRQSIGHKDMSRTETSCLSDVCPF
jgi:hypothetical protein